MREVAATQRALGLPDGMSRAAVDWQESVAAVSAEPGEAELLARVDRLGDGGCAGLQRLATRRHQGDRQARGSRRRRPLRAHAAGVLPDRARRAARRAPAPRLRPAGPGPCGALGPARRDRQRRAAARAHRRERGRNVILAARRLGLAQPTVQRAIGQLEEEARRAPSERTARGFVATRPCRARARAARLAFTEFAQAEAELAEIDGRAGARIVVGAPPLSPSVLLPRAHYTACAPAIRGGDGDRRALRRSSRGAAARRDRLHAGRAARSGADRRRRAGAALRRHARGSRRQSPPAGAGGARDAGRSGGARLGGAARRHARAIGITSRADWVPTAAQAELIELVRGAAQGAGTV